MGLAANLVTAPAPRKGFGELFAEGKNKLDHLQKTLASVLPAMPGMPVAKFYDLAIGVDFHDSVFPPSPLLPVPHIGMVYDIMSAVMSAVASVVPAPPKPPPPPEDGSEPPEQPTSVSNICKALVHGMAPSVQVHGQWVANAGAGIQHLPGLVAHVPFPVIKPMASSEMFMGSSTVLADGGPCSTQFHPALSCNLVGLPSPLRRKPKSKTALMAPTSMLAIITSGGAPVLVGGPPTIDLFQLALKLGLKGMGKLWKKARDIFKGFVEGVKKAFPKLAEILKSIKCKLFGEPVDAATGRVVHTNVDFELPGPIPLIWERTYYSDAEVNTPLGYNWHHSYNMGLCDMGNGFALRLSDGRETSLPYLVIGEIFYHRVEQLFFKRDQSGYFITDADTLQYRFEGKKNMDGFAMLSSITNPQGFNIFFNYNYKGNLTEIIDSCGRHLNIENDQNGHVRRIYTLAGKKLLNLMQYDYDEPGNMIGTEDVMGAVKRFEYNDHLLVKLTNQMGHSFYWEYEGKGDNARCIHTWGDGGLLEYWAEYNQNSDGSGVTIARDSLGHQTEYYYDASKLIYKILDANGGITRQIYNQYQDLEILINPEGGKVKYSYNDYGKIVAVINENNESSSFSFDANLNLIKASSAGKMSISMEYDVQGRLVSRRGVAGNIIYYEYQGRYLKRITDHKQRSFELDYDKQHNLVSLRYPNGLQQNWEYDAMGNVLLYKDVRSNITQYQYDDTGNIIQLTEPDGNIHRFEYDIAGNLVEANDLSHRVEFEYGPLGVLRGRKQNDHIVRFNYDTELQLRSIVNEGGEVYKFGLDGIGNVVSEWGFDGLNRRYLRDGNGRVVKVLRPQEKWTVYDYDAVGNIVREEHSDTSMTAYKYNPDGLLIEALNETSHIKLQRDKAGVVVKEIQDGYEIIKTYDSDGNCTHTGSSLGADIQMHYDEWGMLKEMNANGTDFGEKGPKTGISPFETKQKEIEAKFLKLTGRATTFNIQGNDKGEDKKGNWKAVFERDDTGLELRRFLSGGLTVQTDRDQLGRVTRRTIGAKNVEQSRVAYEWGRGNKLHKIVNELTSTKADFEYDAFDNLISATYNEKGFAETVYRIPDKIGNLFKTKDRSDRKYSKGGRLQEDNTYCYYYDAEGNLIFKEFKRNENLSAVDKTAYLKPLNIIPQCGATGWAYEWAGNGMLQKVINPGGREIEFYYDPLGRRTAKVVRSAKALSFGDSQGESVARFIWDGNIPLHEWKYEGTYPPAKKIDQEGIKEEKEPVENMITWVFEDGSFVPCARLHGDNQCSIVTDYLGTPTHAYDSKVELVWERELDVYGAARKQKGKDGFIPYLYQGQYVDEETGLAYNRFRYYDNESGGYISQDPIGLAGNNPTMYGYVKNSNSQGDLYGLDVYVLTAADDGWYPVYEYGTKDPVAYTKLKKGEIYKIGETQRPKARYSQPSLDKTKINRSTATGITFDANGNPIPAGVTKKTISTGGTKSADRALENKLLKSYHNKHGRLPAGNKHFH